MATTESAKRSPIREFVQQLSWREDDGTITVTPQDKARFCIKLNRAIEFLKVVAEREQFDSQFQLLSRIIAEWMREHSDVDAAYVTLRDGSLCLVVVRGEAPYNDEFEDALSALDIAIASDSDLELIRLTAVSLPQASEEAIASFLDPRFTVQIIHGEARGPHSSGE